MTHQADHIKRVFLIRDRVKAELGYPAETYLSADMEQALALYTLIAMTAILSEETTESIDRLGPV